MTRSTIRFNLIDQSYLHMEAPGRPMHWAMVIVLAPGQAPIGTGELAERVAERVRAYALFRIAQTRGRLRAPRLALDAEWDPRQSVSSLPTNDHRETRRVLGVLMEHPLPPGRPSWDVVLVTERGGRQLIVIRVHHSNSDGLAGAAYGALVADAVRGDLREFDRFLVAPRFELAPIDPDTGRRAVRGLYDGWKHSRARPRWPRLSRAGARDVALVTIPTGTIRREAMRRRADMAEYLVAAYGSALSAAPPSANLPHARIVLPAALDQETRHTGNAVGITLARLPLDRADLEFQLASIRGELQAISASRAELALPYLSSNSARLPWWMRRIAAKTTMTAIRPDVHMSVNPGFSKVRSVLGRSIADIHPLSPLAGYSLSVTCLILGSRTYFGMVADSHALPADYLLEFAKHFVVTVEGGSASP